MDGGFFRGNGVLLRIVFSALVCFGFPLCAQKKKVLILSANVGAGHAMAACALAEQLSAYFECNVINMFEQLDPLYAMSGGSFSVEKTLASFHQKDFNAPINFFHKHLSNAVFLKPRWKKIEEQAYKIFSEVDPHLIISVIPALAYPFVQAAKRLDKPFILSVLDADYTMWMKGVELIHYDKFRLIIPFKAEDKQRQVAYVPKNVRHQTLEWGVPLRKALIDSFNKSAFKKKWHFVPHKPNVLLMMGGQSSKAVVKYVKALCALPRDYHIFVFVGLNEVLGEEVKKLVETSRKATFEVVPFTKDVPYFMRTADLLISKAGGLTCAEVQTAQIKTIFDATTTPLFWEASNMHQVVKSGYGRRVYKLKQIDRALTECLNDKKKRDFSFKNKELFFGNRILALARKLTR